MKKIIFIALILILTPFVVHAETTAPSAVTPPQTHTPSGQGTFYPIVPIEGITYSSISFPEYAKRIFNTLIQLGALLSVLMIVYGGFEYMTSAAGITKKDGAEKIRNAVTGLILLLASYLILSVINPCLVTISIFSTDTGPCSAAHTSSTTTASDQQLTDEQLATGPIVRIDANSCTALVPVLCADNSQSVLKCSTDNSTELSDPTDGHCASGSPVNFCQAGLCLPAASRSDLKTLPTDGSAQIVARGGACDPGHPTRYEGCVYPDLGNAFLAETNCSPASTAKDVCMRNGVELGTSANLPPATDTLSPIPSTERAIGRTATCPTAYPNKENICRYGNNYSLGDECVPDSAKAALCIRTCTDANDHNDCQVVACTESNHTNCTTN